MGIDKLVIQLSTDTWCTLYGSFKAIYIHIEILISNCMLPRILAASSLTDDFEMCIMGHIFGGCIGSIVVN